MLSANLTERKPWSWLHLTQIEFQYSVVQQNLSLGIKCSLVDKPGYVKCVVVFCLFVCYFPLENKLKFPTSCHKNIKDNPYIVMLKQSVKENWIEIWEIRTGKSELNCRLPVSDFGQRPPLLIQWFCLSSGGGTDLHQTGWKNRLLE